VEQKDATGNGTATLAAFPAVSRNRYAADSVRELSSLP